MHLERKLRRAASKVEISYVGGGVGSGYTTMPTHQSGDLIVVVGISSGTMSTPSGWTTLFANQTNGDRYAHSYYKVASSASETINTSDGITRRGLAVYRSTDGSVSVGAKSGNTGNGNPRTYNGLSLTGSNSYVLCFGFTRRGTYSTLIDPSGTTRRVADDNGLSGSILIADTNSAVSSWASVNVSDISTSFSPPADGWATVTVEIIP